MTQKDKTQIAVTGVLVLVLILMVARAVKKIRGKRVKVVPITVAPPLPRSLVEPASVPAPAGQTYDRLKAQAQEVVIERDPFTQIPIRTVEDESVNLQIIGIAWDEKEPQAIINNYIVGVGSTINGYRVIEITETKVILENDQERIELKLYL